MPVAESDVGLALGSRVGRRLAVPLFGEPLRVERREARCVRDELEAWLQRELTDPLEYGDGQGLEQAGLPEGTGSVRGQYWSVPVSTGQSSLPGKGCHGRG